MWQAGDYTFNRAKLMNIGFREAMREEEWDCLFFHDVDLIPEDDRNTYICDKNPKHAAIAMDKFGYKSVQTFHIAQLRSLGFKGAGCDSPSSLCDMRRKRAKLYISLKWQY